MNPREISLEAERVFLKVKAWREHLHQHPELSFQEFKTMAYVSNALTEMGIPHETEVGKTGVVALIESPQVPNRWMGIRADLDALPIVEQNEVPYKSLNHGVMHACGHDVHTSILLGTAEVLWKNRTDLPISVKLIFQPGEEMAPGGATLMIADGVLENPKIDKLLALHVFPDMSTGHVGLRSGLYMASSDELHIDIQGLGGHGALPEKCINPITIAAEIVLSLPKMIEDHNRDKVPTVISFGRMEALGSTNVIPSVCSLKGTFRTMNEAWREEVFERMADEFKTLELKHSAKIIFNRGKGYPFLENDPVFTESVQTALEQQLGGENVHPLEIRMTAEDFAFYSHKLPVCFFRLGVSSPDQDPVFGVHHPQFDIDTSCLITGVESMVAVVFSS